MGARFANRLARAQQAMAEQNLDLLIVNNRENLIYFTGLTQIECLAVLIPREGEPCAVTLWLDGGYVAQQSGLKTFGYMFPRENLGAKMADIIRGLGLQRERPRFGFERYFVPFAVYETLRDAFPEAAFVNASDLFYKLRAIKEPGEVELMRRAARSACAGMAAAIKAVRPGAAELEVLAEAEYAMIKAGSGGSSFRPQVVSGPRTLLTHPCASEKKIETGEVVVIHLGATCDGYCAKMCRTVAVGDIPAEQAAIYRLLVEAQAAAIEALRPGKTADEVDAAARRLIEAAGYGRQFLDVTGYGVGLRQSEFYPIIGRGRPEAIEAGMVVDLLISSVYRPGVGGPRVTDVILVGEEENEILTDFPRTLFQV